MALLVLGLTVGFLIGVPCGGEFVKAIQRRAARDRSQDGEG